MSEAQDRLVAERFAKAYRQKLADDARLIEEIAARVRPTIAPTFSMVGGRLQERMEGRISQDDFEALMRLLRESGAAVGATA